MAAATVQVFATRQRPPLFAVHSAATPRTATCQSCQTCSMRELCLPAGLTQAEMAQLDAIVNHKRTIKRGNHLYRTGSELRSLYAIRIGFIKSSVLHDNGREQVTGFNMMGELLGFDAIGTGKHMSDAIALEDTEVCEIRFSDLERLSTQVPALQQHFHRMMSREIMRDHGMMLLLGSMRAEERLAAFLLNLSQRFASRGYSAMDFLLRMTREEIGSYLGLKLETVSRVFSQFQSKGYISVKNKSIGIKNSEELRTLISQ